MVNGTKLEGSLTSTKKNFFLNHPNVRDAAELKAPEANTDDDGGS